MTRDQAEKALFEAIRSVAPEVEPGSVPRDADLREELDIDSMDFLRLVTELSRALALEIPERDYPALWTIDGAVAYLSAK